MLLLWWMQSVLPQPGKAAGPLGLEGIWPQTITGWVTLVTSLLVLLGLLYGYAKALTAINGLGGRVGEVERKVSTIDGQNSERDKAFALLLQSQETLVKAIGRAEQAASQCDTNSENYFIQIGTQISELGKKVEASSREEHGRLTAIETELRLRNQASPLYIDKSK